VYTALPAAASAAHAGEPDTIKANATAKRIIVNLFVIVAKLLLPTY
jgi:hypothetical protein